MPSDSSASLPPLDWLISGMAAKIYKLLPPIHLSPSPTASNNQQFAPEASKLQQSSEVPSIVKKKKLRRLRRKNVPKNVPEKMLAENQLKSIEKPKSTTKSIVAPRKPPPVYSTIDYKHQDIRPTLNYFDLVSIALKHRETGRATLTDICDFLVDEFAYFRIRQDSDSWKNSIRHLLSQNDQFIKTQKMPHERGRGAIWMLRGHQNSSIIDGGDQQQSATAEGVVRSRRRYNRRDALATPQNSVVSRGDSVGGGSSGEKNHKLGPQLPELFEYHHHHYAAAEGHRDNSTIMLQEHNENNSSSQQPYIGVSPIDNNDDVLRRRESDGYGAVAHVIPSPMTTTTFYALGHHQADHHHHAQSSSNSSSSVAVEVEDGEEESSSWDDDLLLSAAATTSTTDGGDFDGSLSASEAHHYQLYASEHRFVCSSAVDDFESLLLGGDCCSVMAADDLMQISPKCGVGLLGGHHNLLNSHHEHWGNSGGGHREEEEEDYRRRCGGDLFESDHDNILLPELLLM